jgi:tmRNA-binding protein
MPKPAAAERLIAENRRARYDYFIEDRLEAGIALEGWEVKSMRAGRAQLAEAYVYVRNGEAFLIGAHLAPLRTASTHRVADPVRTRKLLLHRHDIRSFRWSCIGSRGAPNCRSGSPRARSSTTNARRKRSATGSAIRRG